MPNKLSIFLKILQLNGATYPSRLQVSAGGVGRNLAESLWKIYGSSYLISVVGNDQNGKYIQSLLPPNVQQGVEIDETKATANSALIFDRHGDSKIMLCDMSIHTSITPEMIIRYEKKISKSPLVVMDGNLSIDTIMTALELCQKYNIPVFFEPTDMLKAGRIFRQANRAPVIKQIKFISPNIFELRNIAQALNYSNPFYTEFSVDSNDEINLNQFLIDTKLVSHFVGKTIDNVIVTLGPLGQLISSKSEFGSNSFFDKNQKYISYKENNFRSRFYRASKITKIANVSGAGDSFASGFIAGMLKGLPENVCVSVGLKASAIALASHSAVPNKYFDQTDRCWTIETPSKNI